ncbi:MAG: autoinducer binding domain-containing protein [Paracoccaceae bacterium]|nr:autoinducer binding domain-containing protein [Paracoccaceae bacterium]
MVLALLSRIAQAERVDEVWQLATGHFRTLGFSRLNYGLTRFLSDTSIGTPEDALYLSTLNPAYMKLYFQDGFYARTPLYRWTLQNTGTCTWRWVFEDFAAGRLPPVEAEAVRMNIEMGVTAGLTISFPECNQRTKGAFGLIADRGLGLDEVDAIWARQEPEIMALANVMHLKIVSLPARSTRRGLTQRQREALEWVADGKTTQDIAVIMGVSAAMVEKHLRLARAALDVDTTAQAVAKAMLLNMIFNQATPRVQS